ncbi:type IV pilin protein [Methylotuvimicrobium buryatense]|uniref:Type IV pilin protein n=1 Tax=Methylotuvimicrobium buryatense TaxID=95641 RepID=A0A4V1IJJ3_METBY|nr:type IV pilin protein [Methylotuvimicrobium buryatense]QCW81605.1 type IV pilin protein [Methylotuvimicrobium buryatense]
MKAERGFTLIELMIAVAVVGILAGIAYPSYQDSIRKSRRADAKGALMGLANAMERHFTETNSYVGAAGTDATPANTGAPRIYSIPGQTATFYTITISAAAAATFTVQAVPTGAQNDPRCGTLTLAHTGARGITGTGSVAECW